jgi:hypothetical protein
MVLETRQNPLKASISRQIYGKSKRCFAKISGAKRNAFFSHWLGRIILKALIIFFFIAPSPLDKVIRFFSNE